MVAKTTIFTEFARYLDRFPRLRAVLKKVWHLKRYLLRRSEGEKTLFRNYYRLHGKPLDIENPVTFTDMLFCRLVSWNRQLDPRFTELTDKYLVRAYVASKVGDEHLTRLFWHGKNPHLIPFDQLPMNYVIKTNHGSAQVILVKGSVDRDDAIKKLKTWLKSNHYWKEREYQYFRIKPRVMVEEYLDDGVINGPLDYRFWCFHGVPELIQVDNHRHDINPFYDATWHKLDLSYRINMLPFNIEKPTNLDNMLYIASSLSADFDFVRVDLYNLRGKIYFGELTFTPVAGFLKFRPEVWDLVLGEKWQLSR